MQRVNRLTVGCVAYNERCVCRTGSARGRNVNDRQLCKIGAKLREVADNSAADSDYNVVALFLCERCVFPRAILIAGSGMRYKFVFCAFSRNAFFNFITAAADTYKVQDISKGLEKRF